MTHRSDWCHLGRHDACTSPFCWCDVCHGCEKRETRSTKGETVLGSSGEAWDTEGTNKAAPGRCVNTVHPGASPTGLESTSA